MKKQYLLIRHQIEQDMGMCKIKFGDLVCLPIAAQFIENDLKEIIIIIYE